MYLEHFGFNEFPFKLTSDTDYLFLSPSHSQAIAYLEYAAFNREGFVVITGETGSGKTTLVEKFMMGFDKEIIFAKIFQTQLNEVELLQAILVEFGLNPFNANKIELLSMLNQFLIEKYLDGKQILIIIDNAQNLSKCALKEITMLSGVETQKEKIVHIVLIGEPELNDTIESKEMEQLLQRVNLRYNLRVLTRDEVKQYISHRLKVAGSKDVTMFNGEVLDLIYKYTNGVPRLVNILCDTVLTCSFADDETKIEKKELFDAVKELRWNTYKERYTHKDILDLDLGGVSQNLNEENNYADGRDISGFIYSIKNVASQIKRIADVLEKNSK